MLFDLVMKYLQSKYQARSWQDLENYQYDLRITLILKSIEQNCGFRMQKVS